MKHNDDKSRLIVAVLGDVNHGKTTLLDHLTKSQNAAQEPGDITQDIRMQYLEDPEAIMLDTPGHHVFDGVRATAINAADLVVLVVAANRGPQSQAAQIISDCNHQNKELLLVISKVDLAGDMEKASCYENLEQLGCVSENIGGDVATVEVSVKASPAIGIDKLKEYLSIFASNKIIRQDTNKPSMGKILDVFLGKRAGFDALVKIENGSFELGNYFCAEKTMGRIRCLWDVRGAVEKAAADNIVLINGFEERPEINTMVQIVRSKRDAIKLLKAKKRTKNQQNISAKKQENTNLDSQKTRKNLVLKAESDSNLQVLRQLLAEHNIRFCSLGNVTPAELDSLKKEENSALICFGKLSNSCKKSLSQFGITYYADQVIYQLTKKLQDKKEIIKKVEVGRAEVLKVFDFNGTKIAGCKVGSGIIKIGAQAELIRDGEKNIFTGKITSLKHEKNKITEAKKGSTFGAVLSGKYNENNDYLPKDEIIAYEEHREITWEPFFQDPINQNKKFKK
jgi:translation initiation factor IF-2